MGLYCCPYLSQRTITTSNVYVYCWPVNHCTVIFELDHVSYVKALEVIQFSETKGKSTGCEGDSLPNKHCLHGMQAKLTVLRFWYRWDIHWMWRCWLFLSSECILRLMCVQQRKNKILSTKISIAWSKEICMILRVVFTAMVYIIIIIIIIIINYLPLYYNKLTKNK